MHAEQQETDVQRQSDLEALGLQVIRFTNEQVAAMAGVERNTNIFAVDLAQARSRLLAEPWIFEARLERQLPDELTIVVEERRAQALAVLGDHLYLVSCTSRP